jgi:hypothetical protein
MTLAPILEREEYVEQAYCFRVFRERLMEGMASQEVLSHLHAEVLSTTRLPYAIQFLATELKHTGLLSPGFERLSHYFTPFQAFVVRQTEREKMRFGMESALQILEGEARYRSEKPNRTGLFVFQFEAISRNRLGYDEGLTAMAGDDFYDQPWRVFMERMGRSLGDFDFGDLVYFASELYIQDQRRLNAQQDFPEPLFGEKEGKIAKAARGHDPLFLFAALQRHLGYPAVPRPVAKDDPIKKLLTIEAHLREIEQRLKLLETEARGKTDLSQFVVRPEILNRPEDEEDRR